MNSIRLLAGALIALFLAHTTPAHGAGLTVDESTGLASYRYQFDLPKARGRFQPTLSMVSRIWGGVGYPMAGNCVNSSEGYGDSWGLELPFMIKDGSFLYLYSTSTDRPIKLVMSSRENAFVSEVETSYFKAVSSSVATDPITATDAAGNTWTFASPSSSSVRYRLRSVQDLDGNVTLYSYDESDRLVKIAYDPYKVSAAQWSGVAGQSGYYATTVDLEYLSISFNLSSVSIKVRAGAGAVQGPYATVKKYQMAYQSMSSNSIVLTGISLVGGESGPEQSVTTFEPVPAVYGVDYVGSGCLAAVVTPTGGRIDILYKWSSLFGDPATQPYPMVASVSTSGVGVASTSVRYWYKMPGRATATQYPGVFGFIGVGTVPDQLGFAESWTQDSTTSQVRHTTWDVSSRAFLGMPLQVEIGTPRAGSAGTATEAPLSDAFRTLRFSHAARSIGAGSCTASPTVVPAADYPVIPVTTSETDERLVGTVRLTSQRTTPCSAVDQWGNATQVTIDPDTAYPGDEFTISSTFRAGISSTEPCKDCVATRATVAGTWTGGALLDATKLDYDAKSRIQVISRKAKATDGNYQTQATFAWADNGNLTSRIEKGVATYFTYDDYFLVRVARAQTRDAVTPGTVLGSDTDYDTNGRPRSITGPYVTTYIGGPTPASGQAQRYLDYDSLGRVRAVARKPFSGTTVTEGLLAIRYTDAIGQVPASITTARLAIAKNYVGPTPPSTNDSLETTAFLDGFGRQIQVRERLGGTGSGDAAANITQNLGGYRVTSSVVLDGVGRFVASLAPYYSAYGAFRDPTAGTSFAPSTAVGAEVVRGPVQATFVAYDGQGRPVCSTLRAVTTTLAAAKPPAGSCASSFFEDSNYARATATIYRGVTVSGRSMLGVKTVEPRFTMAGSTPTGPEVFIDAAGLARRTLDAEGNGATMLYDLLLRPTGSVRQAGGTAGPTVTSTVTLDMMGRVTNRTDPNFGRRSLTYDDTYGTGLLQTVRFDKTGDEVRYSYDMGRLKRVEFCRSGQACTTDAEYQWDLPYLPTTYPGVYQNTAGRLAAAFNAGTTVALSYDDSGAITRRDQWLQGVTGGFAAVISRGADGRVLQTDFTAPGLSPFSYQTSYDSLGRPVRATAGTSTLWSATNASDNTGAYNAFGAPTAATVDDGLVAKTWDYGVASGLLMGQSVSIPGAASPVVYQVGAFAYRGTQLTGYKDLLSNTTYAYWYSDTNRLVAARATPGGVSALSQSGLTCVGFAKDDNHFGPGPSLGNIEVVREGSATPATRYYGYSGTNIEPVTTGGVQAGPDAPTSVGLTGLTYDVYGRVASKGGGTELFAYDLAGRLISVSRSAGASEVLGYDPFGTMLSRQGAAGTTFYVGRIATVVQGGGGLQVDVHVSPAGQRLASVRIGSAPRTLFLHRDRLTSVVATTLAGGVAGASYRYSPHGAVEVAVGDAGAAASELGYAGALRLSGGLLWMGARVYDPALKIFLQPDPLAPFNYTYAGGDPINRWDPTGMTAIPCKLDGCGGPLPSPDDSFNFIWRETGRSPTVVTAPFLESEKRDPDQPPPTLDPASDGISWANWSNFLNSGSAGTPGINRGAVAPASGGRNSGAGGAGGVGGGSIGKPGAIASMIPVYGSARSAIDEFQNGEWGWGLFDSVLAVSDAFLVKALATGIAKGAFKLGSHTWKATRAWYGASRNLAQGTHVHHWLVPQRSGALPMSLKNQPWNLLPLDGGTHMSLHGLSPTPFGPAESLWIGTPAWAKWAAVSATGHAVDAMEAW